MINFDLNIEEFLVEIDALCDGGLDFLEAVVFWCEKNDADVDNIAVIIKKTPELKSRMTVVAQEKNFLKKQKITD